MNELGLRGDESKTVVQLGSGGRGWDGTEFPLVMGSEGDEEEDCVTSGLEAGGGDDEVRENGMSMNEDLEWVVEGEVVRV